MACQDIFHRSCAFVPCDHAGHVEVGEVFVHKREISVIVAADGDIRGHHPVLVLSVFVFVNCVSVTFDISRGLKITFLFENVPDMLRDVTPLGVVADVIYSFHFSDPFCLNTGLYNTHFEKN